MNWIHLGRQVRAIRLRLGLTQGAVATAAHVSRGAVSLIERGAAARLTLSTIEAVLAVIGARLDLRLLWNGTELDRMADSLHATLAAAIKRRLERWHWIVLVEVSYNHYGDRGRIDLLAWHPATGMLLVIELKTDLVNVQALLGSLDVKTRLARGIAASRGWAVTGVVPAIIFTEDRTTRRRLGAVDALFDRFAMRGREAVSWLRTPVGVPSGLLWITDLTNARVVRISGQRARQRRG
jgi:transcriptional regulator with XRE-family HTH domain